MENHMNEELHSSYLEEHLESFSLDTSHNEEYLEERIQDYFLDLDSENNHDTNLNENETVDSILNKPLISP